MMNLRNSVKKKRMGPSAPLMTIALAGLLGFSVNGSAQSAGSAAPTGGVAGSAHVSGVQNMPDNDTTRGKLASMNNFLEAHPELTDALQKDPHLLNDQKFLEAHPALQQYLQENPQVRGEVQENPSAFMQAEERFDRREDRRDLRGELAATDRFLDEHPEIAEQVRKDPALLNNPKFQAEHPALQQFLQEHPDVRAEMRENVGQFMRAEERFDQRGDDRDRRGMLATADRFLDGHPEIAEQLQKDPSLVNNKKFVEGHPALQQFLQEHPEVRQDFQSNPSAFMQEEQRFEHHEDMMGQEGQGMPRPQEGRMAATDRFLDSHPEIAEQLQKDPSLVNNQKFVQQHPALQQYLQQHPETSQEFQSNPAAFMQAQQRYEQREDSRSGMSFERFLGNHSEIAEQISQNPSLLNNKEYLEGHPDLQQYLKAHPEAQKEFTENPNAFISALQSGTSMTGTQKSSTTTSKPKQ